MDTPDNPHTLKQVKLGSSHHDTTIYLITLSETPVKQRIIDMRQNLKALDAQINDDNITVGEQKALIKQVETDKQAFQSVIEELADNFIRFAQSPAYSVLFPRQYCPVTGPSKHGLNIYFDRISESKKAIVLTLSRYYNGAPIYCTLLIPFDYLEDREAYVKRRADYLAAQNLKKLKAQIDKTNEKINALNALRIELEASLKEGARKSGLLYTQRDNNVTMEDYSYLKY